MYPNYLTHFYHSFPDPTYYANVNTIDSFAKIIHKPQRERTSFTNNHLKLLEDCFAETKHPDTNRREKLATQLGLPPKTVQIWFQNRRAKQRRSEREKTSPHNVKQKETYEYRILLSSDLGIKKLSNILPSMNQQEAHQSASFYDNTSVNDGACFDKIEIETSDNSFQDDATVVQVVDSSNRHSTRSSTDCLHKECNAAKEITIVHIPETLQNSDITGENKSENVFSILHPDTTVDENNAPILPSTTEMYDIDERVNLDLIVQIYEVLLSSENSDLLIANWLTESGVQQQEVKDGNNFTLEDNLKRFINYCNSRVIKEN